MSEPLKEIFGLPVGIADWMPPDYLAIVSEPQVKVTSCLLMPWSKGWHEEKKTMSVAEFLDRYAPDAVDIMTIVLRDGAFTSDWQPSTELFKGMRYVLIVAMTEPKIVTIRLP